MSKRPRIPTAKASGPDRLPRAIFGEALDVPAQLDINLALRELFIIREWTQQLRGYLDARLLFGEAPKYNIIQVDFWDARNWDDGSIAKIRNNGPNYFLHLNPGIDRGEAARWLSKRTGLRITPEEVYTFAFFHECGHTPAAVGRRCSGVAAALNFHVGEVVRGEEVTPGLIARRRIEAEAAADEWAIKEFKKWRRAK